MKKKPNYALRRRIAKIFIVIIVIAVLIAIYFDKIQRIPVYIEYSGHRDLVSSLFDVGYELEDAKDLLKKLDDTKKIDELNENYVKTLSDKGYKPNTISFILLNFNKLEIKKLLNKEYNSDLEEYIKLDLFNYDNYQRYLDFQEDNKELSLEDIVLRVELNLDKYPYETPEEETDPNSLTALVNKHRYISKDYVPDDLVDMEDDYANNLYGVKQIRRETYEQFKKMVDDAKKEGIIFYAESGYRDYEYQETLYREYANEYGEAKANTFAARAGFSEHQLGTTLDLANIWTIEEGDKEYDWINKNGYKYGFIFRYKSKYEDITGYAAEGWHIRYIGVDAATVIHKKDISFDEYWIKYVKNNSK